MGRLKVCPQGLFLLALLVGLLSPIAPAAAAAAAAAATTDSGNHSPSQRRSAAAAAATAAAVGPVGLLLQLTDIHLSAMEGPAGGPQRAPDLLSLSSALLSRWPLAAAVVTGDLTEAKDVYGRGDQDEREWQTYNATWRALSTGGVPYNHIYDIRGNHDTFNSGPRCGARDFYCRYSACAAAGRGPGGRGAAATAAERGIRCWRRISVDAVYGRGSAAAAADGGGGGGRCPVAVVVGVDASLDPGLRSPTNFLGVVTEDVLDELDEQLSASLAAMRAAGCSPPYIAYGHYPLSTIAYPSRRRTAAAATASVQQVLVRHGVSAYLAGHLHGAFGRKLHRLHEVPAGAASPAAGAVGAAAVTAAATVTALGDVAGPGSVSGAELGPHGSAVVGNGADVAAAAAGPAAAGLAAAAAAHRPTGHMLELEMVDWKYARTVRLLTLDPAAGGAVVGFGDFRYRPPTSSPQSADGAGAVLQDDDGAGGLQVELRPPQLEPFDSTAAVGSYLPLITCPPDARYSPQLATAPHNGAGCGGGGGTAAATAAGGDAGGGGRVTAIVRVMLLPMGRVVPAVPKDVVYLGWACGGGGGPAAAAATAGVDGGDSEEQRERLDVTWSSSASAAAAPPSRRGSSSFSGAAVRSRGDGRRLSGVVRMQLEFSNTNYSTFTADLLAPEGEAGDGAGDVRSCPAGLIVVQVRVGGGGGGDGGGGGAESASEERPLHWHPPPPAAAPASAAPQDAFWVIVNGGVGGVADVQGTPVPLHQTALEWLVMRVPWHSFGCFAFAAQWCVLALGMLALPRVIAVLQARRAQVQGHVEGQRRWRRRRGYGSAAGGGGSGSGEEYGMELGDVAGEAGAAATSRHVDFTGEGVSTSVRLGGVAGHGGGGSSGGKLAALKRNNSGSSSGCSGNGHAGGADTWASGLAGSAITTTTPRGRHYSPFRRDGGGGGGGGNGGGGDPASAGGGGAARVQAGAGAGGGAEPGVWQQRVRAVAWRLLLWPLADLGELAGHHDSTPWLALVAFVTYLAVGPWLAASFVGPAAGGGAQPALSGYGILTAYGIYIRPLAADAGSQAGQPRAGWVAAPSQDHAVIVNVVVLVTVAPGLLLCASAAARLRRMAAGGRRCGGVWQLLSWRQAVALCGIAALNLGLCWKLWAGLGWAPVLLSPAVGWLIPLFAAWMWLTVSRVAVAARVSDQNRQGGR